MTGPKTKQLLWGGAEPRRINVAQKVLAVLYRLGASDTTLKLSALGLPPRLRRTLYSMICPSLISFSPERFTALICTNTSGAVAPT